jgi:hypothetical protein
MSQINEQKDQHIYVEKLPRTNLSGKFLILKSAHETFVKDWLAFVNFYIRYDIPDTSTNPKNSLVNFKQRYQLNSNEFLGTATDKVLEVFGIKGDFKVISQKNMLGSMQYVPQLSYQDLVAMILSDEKILLGKLIQRNTLIDRFFLYQYSNHKLLYPLVPNRQIISRNYEFKHYLFDTELIDSLHKFLEKKLTNKSTTGYLVSTMIHLLTSVKVLKLNQIQNTDIEILEDHIFSNGFETTKKGDTYLYLLNELRRMLFEMGRTDIRPPRNRQLNETIDKADPSRYLDNIVDIQSYPNYEKLHKQAKSFMLHLKKVDQLSVGTLKSAASNIKLLFHYLLATHPRENVSSILIEHIFDPMNDNNLIEYVKEKRSDSSAGSVIGYIARFLKYAELVTPYVIKHIPRIKKTNYVSARKAMPKHMLKHLSDILSNRPPKTQTIWDKDKADLSWWQHKNVYPVFPMMILIHLFIPLRGAQIRNLCRENSFEFDEFGNISSFIINTDKNVNRNFLQEIPNVWEQLNVVSDFLKWHKAYFPNLPKYIYNEDENTNFPEITPLMITPKNYKPISQNTHMNYFKRVLTQYQIEVNSEFVKEESKKRIQIVWTKDGSELPQTIEELDKKADNYFNKTIESEYDIHSLRVTGATRYLESGLGISLVMKLTGHTSPNMLLNVYNKLQLKEKRELLSTAANKILLIDGEDTSENLQSFLLDEIATEYKIDDSTKIDNALYRNGLFSLNRKTSSDSKVGKKLRQGTDLAQASHPSTWTPMIFGICPGTKCPDGRENRCSICPYLITGKVFLDGIIHQANLKLIQFYRLSKEIYDEQNQQYENSGKNEGIDLLFEEIIGWFEIIKKIENDLTSNKNSPLNYSDDKNNMIVGTNIEPIEIAYLKTNYNAMQMGIEKDHHGLAILMIKAFQIARKGKIKGLEEVLESEIKTIDWIMSLYSKKKKDNLLRDFIEILQ